MKQFYKKSDYINEILRLTKILIYCKFDSEDFNSMKSIIDRLFREMSQL